MENKDSCYVELSRLPTDLLRPAALEQFLRPSIPLTLSSVKVVFDPKGLFSANFFKLLYTADLFVCSTSTTGNVLGLPSEIRPPAPNDIIQPRHPNLTSSLKAAFL